MVAGLTAVAPPVAPPVATARPHVPVSPALHAARTLVGPTGRAADGDGVLAFLQRVADTAVAWSTGVAWAGVVVELDREPFTAAATPVPAWLGAQAPWPGVAVPGPGAALLLIAPVLASGRQGGRVVLAGPGELTDDAVEVAEVLARAVGCCLGQASRRGRARLADELRFAVLAARGGPRR